MHTANRIPKSWTDSSGRIRIPASRVIGANYQGTEVMIDASSTNGGSSDSHLISFATDASALRELMRGKWSFAGTVSNNGIIVWSAHPER